MTFLRYKCPFALLISLLVWSLLSLSCGRDDIKPPVKGKISWIVNGRTYTADYAASAERQAPYNDADVTIRGMSYDRSTLVIELNPIDRPGTFATSDPPLSFHAVQVSVGNLNYWAYNPMNTAVGATVVVTELTADKIVGSFKGSLVEYNSRASEIISVSGTFDVPFLK